MVRIRVAVCRRLAPVILLCLLSYAGASAQKWDKITDEEWATTAPAAYPDAKAVVLFDNGHLIIELGRMIRLERHVRIKVLSKEGAEEALTVEIPYFKKDKIKYVKAHTILPNGKKKDIDDWFEKRAENYYVRTGTFPAVEDGCILEYTYMVAHERYGFLEPWYFQGPFYTEKSKFAVTLDPGFTYSVSRHNIPIQYQHPAQDDGRETTTFTWELENLNPAPEEPLAGATLDRRACLQFQLVSYKGTSIEVSFIATWADIGEGYGNHMEDFYDDTAYLAEVADSLCKDLTTDDAKMKCLYDFVRDRIETIELTEDKDVTASDILKIRQAELADKNYLLVGLLRGAGFNAHPLLIGTRDEHGPFNTSSNQLSQFNRILCYVDEDSAAFPLDAGAAKTMYPHLPPKDLVEAGLLIDGDDTRPVTLNHPKRKNGIDVTSILYVHDDGAATCTTSVYVRGYEVSRFWDFVTDSVTSDEIVDRLLGNALTDYKVQDATVAYHAEKDRLQFDLVLDLPSAGTILDENLFVTPCLVPMCGNPFTSDYRFYPVDFCYEKSYRHRIQMFLPEGFRVADAPANVDSVINGIRYTRKIVYDDSTVAVNLDYIIGKPTFPAMEYGDVKSMFEYMTASASDQLALSKNVEEVPTSEETQ